MLNVFTLVSLVYNQDIFAEITYASVWAVHNLHCQASPRQVAINSTRTRHYRLSHSALSVTLPTTYTGLEQTYNHEGEREGSLLKKLAAWLNDCFPSKCQEVKTWTTWNLPHASTWDCRGIKTWNHVSVSARVETSTPPRCRSSEASADINGSIPLWLIPDGRSSVDWAISF